MSDLGELTEYRLKLWNTIETEKDFEGHDGLALSDAEAKALYLSILDGGQFVSESEQEEILNEYNEAKKRWVFLRNMLIGFYRIRMAKKELEFSIGDSGKIILEQNPLLLAKT